MVRLNDSKMYGGRSVYSSTRVSQTGKVRGRLNPQSPTVSTEIRLCNPLCVHYVFTRARSANVNIYDTRRKLCIIKLCCFVVFHLSLIKHGHDVSLDSSNKGKEPEDIGFPEYSKKFLKRQVRGTHRQLNKDN